MILQKSNAFRCLLVAFMATTLFSCSSEEKSEKEATVDKEPEKVLNEFQFGKLEIGTEYDSIIITDTSFYSSPIGDSKSYSGFLLKEKDSLNFYIQIFDSLPEFAVEELIQGSLMTSLGEKIEPILVKTSDTSYNVTINKELLYDYRIGKNFYMVFSQKTGDNLQVGEFEVVLR